MVAAAQAGGLGFLAGGYNSAAVLGDLHDAVRARRYHPLAPIGYPALHYLTRPVRRAAAAAGDSEFINLRAGTGYRAAADRPAQQILRDLAADI